MSKNQNNFGNILKNIIDDINHDAQKMKVCQKENTKTIKEGTNIEYIMVTNSKTPNAVQENWRVPSEFPLCPQEDLKDPIGPYLQKMINMINSCKICYDGQWRRDRCNDEKQYKT